ncbi:heavy metal-associated isoprenylated plant protein 32-like [Salvia splendens]|uniref:heavy metal-associated isoprenylated plant protein 32-like n=1 Tax=Salvia splendens TaxID=180675 RepID=UPI001C25ABA9|nr:heavy metal-associated isoprenylated plant protein 32-like [Salvia splendens]
MDNYATLRCVLKVHSRCDACKRHTVEILTSITGTYDITMDAERSEAMIVGQVDPNYCIRAISRCNGHAELVWANLKHPKMGGESYGYGSFGNSYGHGGIQVGRFQNILTLLTISTMIMNMIVDNVSLILSLIIPSLTTVKIP